MAERSSIEWTRGDDGSAGSTWNPIRGTRGRWSCVKVSPGCTHCYAERLNVRLGGPRYVVGADTLRLDEQALTEPLRWKKPRRVFVCSMTDLFEKRVPDAWIDRIFGVMIRSPQHTFQVLTKRAERLYGWMTSPGRQNDMARTTPEDDTGWLIDYDGEWPPTNVWLGISAEDQQRLDELVPWLLKTPTAVRFVSLEPLLGPINLSAFLTPLTIAAGVRAFRADDVLATMPAAPIHGVITGGESGGPEKRALIWREVERMRVGILPEYEQRYKAKAEAKDWVCSIRDQCVAAGVPFFFKQWGGPTPKSGGRLLDGRTWDEVPA